MASKDQYAAVSTPGSKRVAICARRIGSRDRLATIAIANTEEHADKIVDALNMMQGKVAELSLPIERELATCKESVQAEKRNTDKARGDLSDVRRQKEFIQQTLDTRDRELRVAKNDLEACRRERDALSEKVAQLRGTAPTPAKV